MANNEGPGNKPQPTPVQPYPATQPYPAIQVYPIANERSFMIQRQSANRRFCKALTIGVLIWLLGSLFVHSVVLVAHWNHHHRWGWPGSGNYPIPSDLTVEQCVTGEQWGPTLTALNEIDSKDSGYLSPDRFVSTSETNFKLPLSSEGLFLLSRGPKSSGSVDIIQSNDVSDSVHVSVSVKYFRESARDFAKACLVRRDNGDVGVGIFTIWPYRDGRIEDYLSFATTVILPASHNGQLTINKFETDVSNTFQRIHDFENRVVFRTISLKSSNAFIEAKSIQAVTGRFQTSNSPIRGKFNVTESLVLQTSNAPIEVNVNLENGGDRHSTDLKMYTSNNVITSDVNLRSSHKSGTGGTFYVTGATSNGHLNIEIPTSPVDSTLHLGARTSNSPATVSLDTAYEGSFLLSTSNRAPTIHERENVEDPSGKGRKRSIQFRTSRAAINGEVQWGNKSKAEGTVNIRSSNAPVTLVL